VTAGTWPVSKTPDSSNIGGMTATDCQTVMVQAETFLARLSTMFEAAHPPAPISTHSTPSSGALAPPDAAISTRPAAPIVSPAHWTAANFSLSTRRASTMVIAA